jgi:peptidoglycan hydrolase CwlO-like protein
LATKKRQQTFAKRKRELEVQEKRALKREKKQAAAAARALEAAGEAPVEPTEIEPEYVPGAPTETQIETRSGL